MYVDYDKELYENSLYYRHVVDEHKEIDIHKWLESEKDDQINMPDNVTIAPWGDLIVCEDNSKINRLWGFNQKGGSYLIAENSYTGSEFAGVCFSPLDNTMYVNLQYNGMTLAIDGNWKKLRR